MTAVEVEVTQEMIDAQIERWAGVLELLADR